jgi:putative oxygen-independent coproporphyrinogen III oxidase
MQDTLAVYIHWPFCKFKCPYCDFNSHVRDTVDHGDWLRAYKRELAFYREKTGPRGIGSVFFGGGTPSLMEPSTAAAAIDEIAALWGLPAGTEITLEANPTSVEAGKLKAFKSAGVNRVSMGVQALDDADLKVLGRQHSSTEALKAVQLASRIFDRYTFDLIYARPHQSVQQWRDELARALDYAGDHMSLYQLTIEEGTSFYTLHQRGDLVIPDEETAAQMYEATQEIMEARGMPAYEVSNHAKPGQESRHNLAYWRYGDYAGIGPGAHGRLTIDGDKFATRAHRAPEVWMERVNESGHGAHPFELIDFGRRRTESLMMGLRLAEGLKYDAFKKETGMPLLDFLDAARVAALEGEGMLLRGPDALHATAAGRQRLNAVLAYLAA